MPRRFILAFSILLACTQLAQAQLPEPVSRALAAANLPDDALSVLVLRGNTTVITHLAERQMQPASTMKLVTTLVALEQLGPVFKGRTELRSAGTLAGEVLKGDLILRGGADADLSGDTLEQMLRGLRTRGIRKIDGRLVLDRQLFKPARTDQDAGPFDEWPHAYYNVIPDALLINKNMLQLDMRSDGKRLQLSAEPTLDRVAVVSAMTLIDGDCRRWEDGWKHPDVQRGPDGQLTVILRGTFPRNCTQTNTINILDRHDYVDRLFRRLWQQLGGSLSGPTVDGATPADARLLGEHVARALPEIVRDINKPSDNVLARTVFLSLGSLEADASGSRPLAPSSDSTFQRADRAVRDWLRNNGVDDSGMVLENGSGLSRLERISALQMGGLLQAGLRSKWAPEFQASIPIAAVDGTMRNRLKSSVAAQRARMKTGTLRNVSSVAGYVTDANGQQCVVVAMINSDLGALDKGRAVLDVLVDWVARSAQQ